MLRAQTEVLVGAADMSRTDLPVGGRETPYSVTVNMQRLITVPVLA